MKNNLINASTLFIIIALSSASLHAATGTANPDGKNENQAALDGQSSSNLWVSAYYDVWQMIPLGATWWAEPPDRLLYTGGMTHIIQFPNGNIKPASPFFGPVGGVDEQEELHLQPLTGIR
jgi:hypothetical protein